MKYFAKHKDGGPYTLSEIVEKFGDDAELIPAKEKLVATKPTHPTQLELPKIPPIDGGTVLGFIALLIALVGCTTIGFGFFASVGQPPEYGMTHAVFGGLGFLTNCLAVIVAVCALIARPTVFALIALTLALLTGAAVLCIPPQIKPRSSPASQLSLRVTSAYQHPETQTVAEERRRCIISYQSHTRDA